MRETQKKIWNALLLSAVLVTVVWVWKSNPKLEEAARREYAREYARYSANTPDAFVEEGEEPLIAPLYPTFENISGLTTMEDLRRYVYMVDETAYVTPQDLDIQHFLATDMSTDLSGNEPKILIYHTHSRETFADSRPGAEEDTIVGVGRALAEILSQQYHIPVVHDRGRYDMVNGKEKREGSYERMEPAVRSVLERFPSIEVTIDLHRDGVPENVRLACEINGVPTARIMMFNGITCLNQKGRPKAMPDLVNPYLTENFALSLQMLLTGNELYPGLMRKNYIKAYRYGLHLAPKAMLVEVGANTNTLQEAKNAMTPFAEILTWVLQRRD
ncbi:MAG: stage II sporulation protein P [Clostridiales bacterium]|jgi:stage II sporulation protein P|nr:stage II sporulation protein P [Clostridiales bacterium]